MPSAIKLQEEYGDSIQVILVESQNSGHLESVGFAMKARWLGTNAIWTSDYLFSTGASGLPNFALISPSGEIVLSGNSNVLHSQIEDAIEEMVKVGSGAPEGAPSVVEKAYVDVAKGKWVKARTALDKALPKAKTDGDRAAIESALRYVDERFARGVGRVQWLADNGFPRRAEALADSLKKGAKGAVVLEEQAASMAELLGSAEFQAELTAAKALVKLESKLYEDAKNPKLVEKVREIAEDHAGTKVAERARELAEVAGYASA